jgi:hypothetical protein
VGQTESQGRALKKLEETPEMTPEETPEEMSEETPEETPEEPMEETPEKPRVKRQEGLDLPRGPKATRKRSTQAGWMGRSNATAAPATYTREEARDQCAAGPAMTNGTRGVQN